MIWAGEFGTEDINEMSRERLIEVIGYLSRALEDKYSPTSTRAYGLGMAEMIKRGEA